MHLIIYNIFIRLYAVAIRAASLFNEKARLWRRGRQQIFKRLRADITPMDAVIWMHCASLGEFEQGRPVLEQLKAAYPDHKILLTFFSPSGYEIRKNYPGADWIYYLPLDTPAHARRFLDLVHPRLVLFVKYEYWYHYLHQLHEKRVPTLLISAIFRENAVFFKWYGGLHRKMLRFFSHIFVQTSESAVRIQPLLTAHQLSVAGDTRFDRVAQIAAAFEPLPVIERFLIGQSQVIVAGSTWPEDEQMLRELINQQPAAALIIAPHEINRQHLTQLTNLFPESVLYSRFDQAGGPSKSGVLIIDNIGMLSKLYQYATIGYIGGGFKASGIHNTLEAAVYGKPVIFGPNYQKFAEAVDLIHHQAALSYETVQELNRAVASLLTQPDTLRQYGQNAGQFVAARLGATERIIQWLRQNAF